MLNGLGDISLDALETIVSISKEEGEIYLENPPPPSLSPFELKGEVSVLFEELYRLSAEAAHAKEPKWEEWTFVLEQIADSLTKWLRNIWLSVWEYQCVCNHISKPRKLSYASQNFVREGTRVSYDRSRLPGDSHSSKARVGTSL